MTSITEVEKAFADWKSEPTVAKRIEVEALMGNALLSELRAAGYGVTVVDVGERVVVYADTHKEADRAARYLESMGRFRRVHEEDDDDLGWAIELDWRTA